MEPDVTTIDLRIHPLDPRRIGPQGLARFLVGKLEAAFDDSEVVNSYTTMTEALLGVHDNVIVMRAC